jgi:hypothetical protein
MSHGPGFICQDRHCTVDPLCGLTRYQREQCCKPGDYCSKCIETKGYRREEEAPSMVGTPPKPAPAQDDIQWPAHYNKGKIQPTDFFLDQQLGGLAWNVMKYLVRYRWKGTALKDLKKARWYLDRLIKEHEEGRPQ